MVTTMPIDTTDNFETFASILEATYIGEHKCKSIRCEGGGTLVVRLTQTAGGAVGVLHFKSGEEQMVEVQDLLKDDGSSPPAFVTTATGITVFFEHSKKGEKNGA